jgi:hypothetical protein
MLFFYDANEAHKIEELSLLFFVYNFEYYTTVPIGAIRCESTFHGMDGASAAATCLCCTRICVGLSAGS